MNLQEYVVNIVGKESGYILKSYFPLASSAEEAIITIKRAIKEDSFKRNIGTFRGLKFMSVRFKVIKL